MTICVGVILAIGSINAQSDGVPRGGAVYETVDRTLKGDRLPLAQVNVPRARAHGLELPDGCDAVVSPLANRQLARIASHCES
jgi:hypothetical protein